MVHQSETFDISRAWAHNKFPGWKVEEPPRKLSDATLKKEGFSLSDPVLVFEHDGKRFMFRIKDITYYHTAQGVANGLPFVLGFCGLCHSGMVFHPFVDGEKRHFVPGGLYDGILFLKDLETDSYWNHITGECMYGKDAGKTLKPMDLEYSNLGTELTSSNSYVFTKTNDLPKAPLFWRILEFVLRLFGMGFDQLHGPGFWLAVRKNHTRSENADDRLPYYTPGLGVVTKSVKDPNNPYAQTAKFYSLSAMRKAKNQTIYDKVGEHDVIVRIRDSSFPEAVWKNPKGQQEDRPFQNYLRWYGFSATFPECEIFKG